MPSGLVIYSIGSFTTAISPNLTVLLIGWSLLEGMGAALILPAIVALVAGNFPTERRTAAYGMVASAGAIAVAAGPLIGGAVTTLFSWRWVFVGEVIVCMAILAVVRKVHDTPTTKQPPIDVVGAIMSIVGLSLVVLGVLKSAEWGWVQPKPEAPALFGVSLTTWFILGGFFVLWLFTQWEARMERLGKEPLLRMELLHIPQLSGGLMMFFFQFLVQASTFFVVPLYLTVVLGLTAFADGCAPGAVVAVTARRRHCGAEIQAAGQSAPRGAHRPAGVSRRSSGDGGGDRSGSRCVGGDDPDDLVGLWHGRAGLAVGRGDGVGGAR